MSEDGPRGGGMVLHLYNETALPWSYFLLKAASRSPRVNDWAESATLVCVATCLSLDPDMVTPQHFDEAMAVLPDSPRPFLKGLFQLKDLTVPDKTEPLRLGGVLPIDSAIVSQDDLLWDAAIILQADYGPEGFHAVIEAVQEPGPVDPRAAVALALYGLLLLSG
jgi:hypothetical protein